MNLSERVVRVSFEVEAESSEDTPGAVAAALGELGAELHGIHRKRQEASENPQVYPFAPSKNLIR